MSAQGSHQHTTPARRRRQDNGYSRYPLLFIALWLSAGAWGQQRTYLETLHTPNQWTDSMMQTLTLRQKIAQLMMAAVYSQGDAAHTAANAKLIREHGLGGVIFFQGSPAAQAEHTNYYQSQSQIPLLIGMDAEWGVGMRLDSVPRMPFQMALGAARNPELAYEMGKEIARQFNLLGMHINFAPVADINNNPENPVINVRSAGENKGIVSQNIVAMMQGMQSGGILACAKHFPGHGNTNVDSHFDVPTLTTSRKSINKTELYPFKQLIDKGVAAIMVGHLRSQALDKSLEIASLSPKIITQVLKKELKFNGLVVTDGMQMKAVTQQRQNAPQANMYALLAGNDILVFPKEIPATIDTIERAVADGRFPADLIDEHCRKVLNTKYYFGLHRGAPRVEAAGLTQKLNTPALQNIKTKIIEEALILASDPHHSIPLTGIDTARIAFVEANDNQGGVFLKTMRRYASIRHFRVNQNSPSTYLRLLDTLAGYDWVIVGYFDIQQRQPQAGYNMNAGFCRFLLQLSERAPAIVALFASPYTAAKLMRIEGFRALLIAHDTDSEYQKAAAEAIFGAIPIEGKSPVTVPSLIAQGQGIERRGVIRLKYGSAQELGIAPKRLANVDSIVLQSIADKAFPGCQVLAAHKSVVFYSKNFGYHTYEPSQRVTSADLYDLASLTKVLATLPLIMKMCEQKTLRLNDPLGAYLSGIPPDKQELRIGDLLMHQSGLKAWLPLHIRYLVSADKTPLIVSKKDAAHPIYVYAQMFLNLNHTLDTAFFASRPSPQYSMPVASGIWAKPAVRQDIYLQIDTSPLDSREYRYSDLGFYYLQRIIEKNGAGLAQEAERQFYRPLGMRRTAFVPLRRFGKSEIAPTEQEPVFRRQLLHGSVHDHGAAIMGGVGGHAGLFSTAEDIVIFMQMLLWNGNYGGHQFFEAGTVERFTQYQSQDSRRALGFDKPDPKNITGQTASAQSYGHTGFTGGMVWADPQRDLIFIFLANRVHPDFGNNLISTRRTRTLLLNEFIAAIEEMEK